MRVCFGHYNWRRGRDHDESSSSHRPRGAVQTGTDDWEQYTERLEQYFKANSIEADDKKLATFLTVMGPTAYALLSNLLAPEKPATKMYAELVTVMRDHLKPKPLVIAERFRFHQRNQADSESVADYMAELRKLADKCEFGEHLTEALRDRLVCGLRSETVQKRLLAEEDLTLKKAYETAISMEAASRRANVLRGSTRVTTVPDGATNTAQYVGRKPRKYLSKGSSAPPSSACNRFHKPRSVPYAIRSAIEQDLERLESSGIIEKVQYSDWVAPVVPVPKGDGGIRLCGDYKVTVNPVLKVDQYPVPTPEDLFATLAGGQTFTKLDLSQAYQQVCLEPESCKHVTINTHKGLYQYTRLPFGVASAPAVFQQLMEKILQAVPGVVVYLDDILITGKNEGEHLANLQQVLERFKQYGIRLKQAKCRIMKPSVDYLGYCIDKNGLHTLLEKISAIQDAPRPKSVKKLRSFLGLVNYYGRFIRDLSTVTYPLNRLLCKGIQWGWNRSCEQAFKQLKQKLVSCEILAHYNPDLPVKLDCDASAYGVGAVLSHQYPNGTERPIAYASRTLSSAEKNYAQIKGWP